MVEVSQTDWELSGCSAAELAALEQWGLEHALMANGVRQLFLCVSYLIFCSLYNLTLLVENLSCTLYL